MKAQKVPGGAVWEGNRTGSLKRGETVTCQALSLMSPPQPIHLNGLKALPEIYSSLDSACGAWMMSTGHAANRATFSATDPKRKR